MSVYQTFVRPVLFRMDPERAHRLSVLVAQGITRPAALRWMMHRWYDETFPELESEVFGLRFSNPTGLAAGWDKSAEALHLPWCLGFGFSEVGSISSDPSPGNPQPRLFRIPEESAIVVNYGLPNDGAEVVANRLRRYRQSISAEHRLNPLGVNIVATNRGTAAQSIGTIIADYMDSATALGPLADYLTLNLSCPNTTGEGHFFSERGRVGMLLTAIQSLSLQRPLVVKVAPDPQPAAIEQLLEEITPYPDVRGVIFNLPSGKPATLDWRSGTPSRLANIPGAVAGRPVARLLTQCLREFVRRMPAGRFHVVGGGGVFTAEDVYCRIRMGASLVQLYSALVFRGPGVVREIKHGLCALLARDGFSNVQQAVGIDVS